MKVLEQGTVPELNAGIDPSGLAAQALEEITDKTLAVNKNLTAGGTMPSKEQTYQAGFTRPGWSHDSHMLAGADVEPDPFENGMASRSHSYGFEGDGYRASSIRFPT